MARVWGNTENHAMKDAKVAGIIPKGPSIIMVYSILIGYFGGLSIYHNDTWTLWV